MTMIPDLANLASVDPNSTDASSRFSNSMTLLGEESSANSADGVEESEAVATERKSVSRMRSVTYSWRVCE
jgi:hypothetical protein